MKKSKFLKVFSSAMALSVIIAGCSSSSSKREGEFKGVEFKAAVDNGGNTVADATYKMGITGASLDMNFSQFAPNASSSSSSVQSVFTETALAQDSKYKFLENDTSRPFSFSVNKENKTLTYKVNEGVTWSNGKPVTAKDIIATYELALHPELQYIEAEGFYNIEGAQEFHKGEAETISGIKEVDEKTVELKLKEVTPSLYFGDGLFQRFENAEQIAEAKKDIAKFAESELNTKPLSYGPYVVDKFIPGETVTYKANEYYWKKDQVKTKNVELKRVTQDQASQVIKAGEVDTLSVSEDMYETVKDFQNGTVLGQPGYSYLFIGMKLGKQDKENQVSVMDPNSKLADPKVREAFTIAVDFDKINSVLYKGLRTTPTGSGNFPPFFDYITDANATGYKFDPERAKKLLDEAGLKDTNGDGIREGKDGKELTFNYLARKYGTESEQTSQAFVDEVIKSWKEVGLNVKQLDGKLFGVQEALPLLRNDAPEVDLFGSGFVLGTNPNNVFGNYHSTGGRNYNRFASPEIDKLLETVDSPEMFDDAKFVETFRNIDKEVAKQFINIPVNWNTSMTFVNKRVKNYDVKKISKGELNIHEIELTAAEPVKG